MEQLAAAAAAQGSDFGGVGGHPLAGGPASRTEHGERTARLPAGALNPSVHPAEAPVPPSGGGPGPLRDRGSGSPTPAGRRGTVPSRFLGIQGEGTSPVPVVKVRRGVHARPLRLRRPARCESVGRHLRRRARCQQVWRPAEGRRSLRGSLRAASSSCCR
ncbi:uncharacterized protein LOC129667550 isoform X1 [Psammomys obesus]|uniref:uncharacterized protein LOC129667550 isoform X1 n=1 Tax=Psammomys obesus TaxID=48139 RepID=UPI0024535979|nr:uncharacterized protein LOC129667550 isoform X1 [Psammomys obesus]